MLAFLSAQSIGTLVIVAVLIFICVIIIKKPIGCLLRLVANTVCGFLALFVINFLGGYIGISIGVNWINAVVIGIFGLPGVALLLILPWFLSII